MQRSGLLTADVKLVAQGDNITSATAAGTPTAHALQRFGHFNGAIKRNDTALGNIASADLTYANNVERIETIRNDGRIIGMTAALRLAAPSTGRSTGRGAPASTQSHRPPSVRPAARAALMPAVSVSKAPSRSVPCTTALKSERCW